MTRVRSGLTRIAVIGGGLSGLSAAHRVLELSRGNGPPVECVLFESSPRLGGIVGTCRIGEYLIDTGADSFLTNKPWAIDLCRRLGLADRLRSTDARYRGAHVLFQGRPVRLPDGFQLISPTAIGPILTTPLLSVWGKLRLLMEPLVPRGPGTDESLASFVRRRFGKETLDRIVQPLVGGIYTSDPEHLSMAATMSRFLEMERVHGSLIRAALAERRSPVRSEPRDASSSGARYGLFAGLAGGMEELLDALRCAVQPCTIRRDTRVMAIRNGAGSTGYQLEVHPGEFEDFDGVIVATAAHQSARLLETLDTELADQLRAIPYASSAIVVTGHRLADVRHPLDSFGLVVPACERRRILATSFSSRKFPERAPADRVLMRTFVGGAMQPELFELSDTQILELVQQELGAIFGVRGEPEVSHLVRYPRAMPQYHVGHLDLVEKIESRVARHPGLQLGGNALHGVGVPDAIHCGEAAAEAVLGVIFQSAGSRV